MHVIWNFQMGGQTEKELFLDMKYESSSSVVKISEMVQPVQVSIK